MFVNSLGYGGAKTFVTLFSIFCDFQLEIISVLMLLYECVMHSILLSHLSLCLFLIAVFQH